MLHPSYADLINAVNSGVEPGEEPVVQSRYSIVIATAKRARQLIAGEEPMVPHAYNKKPLSVAVEELYESKVKILSEEDAGEGESLSIQEGSGEDGGQAPGDVEAEVFGEEAMAQESQDEDETVKA